MNEKKNSKQGEADEAAKESIASEGNVGTHRALLLTQNIKIDVPEQVNMNIKDNLHEIEL